MLYQARVNAIFSTVLTLTYLFSSCVLTKEGPHQFSNVENNSPAFVSDDFVLKVNNTNVIRERFTKTVTIIKNELEKGRLKPEVIELLSVS